jgi:hypothetical protein
MAIPVPTLASGAAVISLTGSGDVGVGQVFTVQVKVDPKGEDVDTVRVNGTYPKDLLLWVGMTLGTEFPNASPGTYYDEGSGKFSMGAFRIGNGTNSPATVATITFKSKKDGGVNIFFDGRTSRAVSTGENRLSNVISLKFTVSGQAVNKMANEQPVTLPTKEELAQNPGLSNIVQLSSLTQPNPDTWYPNRDVQVVWQTGGKAIKESYFSIDNVADSTPTTTVKGQKIATKVDHDGIWFAHLVTVFDDGAFAKANLRLQVDTTPPRRPIPVVEQDLVTPNVPNALRFGTTDDASGIDKYEVNLAGKTVDVTSPAMELPRLDPGVHVATVTAIDKAGNQITNYVSFQVVPFAATSQQKQALQDRILSRLKIFGTPEALGGFVLLTCIILLLPLIRYLLARRKRKKQAK